MTSCLSCGASSSGRPEAARPAERAR
jgi:hypothetical protein